MSLNASSFSPQYLHAHLRAVGLGNFIGGEDGHPVAAAIQVDPYDTGAIAAALRALDSDAELRARLSHAGLERAQHFTMDRYQERLAAMYDTVLAR